MLRKAVKQATTALSCLAPSRMLRICFYAASELHVSLLVELTSFVRVPQLKHLIGGVLGLASEVGGFGAKAASPCGGGLGASRKTLCSASLLKSKRAKSTQLSVEASRQ